MATKVRTIKRMKPADKSRVGAAPNNYGLLLSVPYVTVSTYWVIISYLEKMPMTSVVGYWLLLICAVLSLLLPIIQRHRKNNLPNRAIKEIYICIQSCKNSPSDPITFSRD